MILFFNDFILYSFYICLKNNSIFLISKIRKYIIINNNNIKNSL